MEIAAVFAPTLETPDHIVVAEELGYERAWVYDVPVAWADTGITLALAALRTSKIRLGISVMTEHMRHIGLNAGMVAHLATLAPGRFDLGLGTGLTSALFTGHAPSKWADLERYADDMRTLLAGGEVEVEGARISLMHSSRTGITFPVDVSMFFGAQGPRGQATAQRMGMGVIMNATHDLTVPEGTVVALSGYGTVLEEDEAIDSPRAIEAAGPGAALGLHVGHYGPLAGLPEVDGFLEAISEVDETRRLREMFRGHLIEPNKYDRKFLTADVVRRATLTGTRDVIAAEMRRLEDLGAGVYVYQPAGPDIERELRAFMEAAELRHDLPRTNAQPQPA
ncbi:LLM class flavin-dependent oxidoreductase [Nocardioides sp. GCM10030258]|uniref:LLM class flavin-dependent oxidoreductase n=1 Tax=unclassified Nocardioides TaxID=2615069 RepID=UPI0036103BC2